MTVFNLVRVPVNIPELAQWTFQRRNFSSRGKLVIDEGHSLHHLLTETFGPRVTQPFRLMVPRGGKSGSLYAYSLWDAQALHELAQSQAMPENYCVLDLEKLVSKPMPKIWRSRQRLGFDVRVRPVRRLRRKLDAIENPIKAKKEIDAFLLEALRDKSTSKDALRIAGRSRQAVYLDWFAERISKGAELDRQASRLERFRRIRTYRGNHESEGPDAIIQGELVVTDPEEFAELLGRGIGRHRAYGYGMLLLRPPSFPIPSS